MTKFTTTCRVVGIAENARYSSLREGAPDGVLSRLGIYGGGGWLL